MFTSFQIKGFRGIPELDIDGVKPVTLLVGKNNTAKTSALEAVFLLCGATDPINTVKVANQRGQRITDAADADTAWRSLFHGMDSNRPIEIAGRWEGDGERRLELTSQEDTNYSDDPASQLSGVVESVGKRRIRGLLLSYSSPATNNRRDQRVDTQAEFDPQTQQVVAQALSRPYGAVGKYSIRGTLLSSRSFFNLNRDTEQYGFLVRNRREEEIVQALRLVDPRVRRVAVVADTSGATVYADVGGESLIPLAVCGEGMLRLFSIVLAVTSSRDGVLLIDEIDNGLHYTVMAELWPVLRKLCTEHSVQLIATTHNEEILRYAIAAFRDTPEVFGVFRLDRVGEQIKAVAYQGEVLGAVEETGWEIRG